MERFAWKGRIKPGMQAEYKRLIADKQFLLDTLLSGAEKASYLATKTLRKVQKKVGFAPRSLK